MSVVETSAIFMWYMYIVKYAQTHTHKRIYILFYMYICIYIYIYTPKKDSLHRMVLPQNRGGKTSLNSSRPGSRFQEQEMICLQRLQNSRIVTQSVLEDWMVGKYVSRMDGKCVFFWWWFWGLRNTNFGCCILRNVGNESCWLVT